MGAMLFASVMLIMLVVGFVIIVSGIVCAVICRVYKKKKGKSAKLVFRILNKLAIIIGAISILIPIVFFIMIYGSYDQGQKYENTLVGAVEDQNYSKVQGILKKGTNADQTTSFGIQEGNDSTRTPLMATCGGDINIAKLLLQNHANVNAIDLDNSYKGYNSLFFAAEQDGGSEFIKLFITYGANVNHKAADGESALSLACENGCNSNAELLVKSGANVNAIDNSGESILDHACNPEGYSDYKLIKILISKTANAKYITPDKKSLIDEVELNKKDMDQQTNIFTPVDGIKTANDNYTKIETLLKTYGSKQ